MVPVTIDGETVPLAVRIYKPTNSGPAPTLVFNHGSTGLGPQVNPMIVEGQVHGAVAQGIAAALFEELVYDRETGQPVNGTTVDYFMPTAADLPAFELDHLETPSPVTPFGVKGVGEGGTIAAAAAITNAVCDALVPFGVELDRLPVTAESIWRALADARTKGTPRTSNRPPTLRGEHTLR